MNEALQSWLEAAVASPAVAGCGVRAAGTFQAKSRRPEMPDAQIIAAIKQLSETVNFLQQKQFFTERLRWTFEGGQICCACARGGVMVVLVLNKEAAPDGEVDRLLASCPVLQAG